MAYNALNNLIDAYIYANGVQAITGQILNGVLKQMVSQLGSGYHLMGVAGPGTVPEQNDFAMAYFAATAGEYTDFGGITLAAGEVAVLLTSGNGSWSKQTIYTVPTTTEDLENTAGFITNAVTDLVNYYTKTEVDTTLANYPTLEALATALAEYYTKDEIDALPNGEDIDFDESGKLQFANRVYNAQQPNGMGYKILRKDATFASQVTDANTIYEIRYPFALSANFTMPAGCVLRFNGGSISGAYVLTGNDTRIEYDGQIFDGVQISGTWLVPEIRSSMFRDLSNDGLKYLFALQNANIHNVIEVEPGDYTVGFDSTEGGASALQVLSNSEVIINGTISLDENSRSSDMNLYGYRIIKVEGNDCSIHGEGELVGDITLNGSNTGSGHAIYMQDHTDIEISGLKISSAAGDGIAVGPGSGDIYIHDVELYDWNRNGISVVECDNTTIENIYAHDGGSVDPYAVIDVEPNQGQSVGNIRIVGVRANNVGVGLQYITQSGTIDSFFAKEIYISGCRGRAFEGAGVNSLKTLHLSDITVEKFPSNHSRGLGDILRFINYKNAEIDRMLLDTTDIIDNTSYGCLVDGENITFNQCRFLGNNIFSYHLHNSFFTKCDFEGDYPFWSSNGSPLANSTIERCNFKTKMAQFALASSIIRDCNFDITGFIANYGAVYINPTTVDAPAFLENNYFKVSANGESVNTYYILNITKANVYVIGNVFDNVGGEAGNGIMANANGITLIRNKFFNFGASQRKVVNNSGSIRAISEVFPYAGATADRPSVQNSYYDAGTKGVQYFDETLGKPIWWNGTAWVDATGTAV